MSATALLLSLAALAPTPDEEAWLERLELPSLYNANMRLDVTDADLGIRGYDLGFPEDMRERLLDARDRMEEGERSAAVLHQASSALVGRDMENLRTLLPACLAAYGKELEAQPEDFALHVGFAKALELAGTVTRDDRFFRDSSTQFESATALRPDDWQIQIDHAGMLVTRSILGMRAGEVDPQWLATAEELTGTVVEAAPEMLSAHWRLFHTRHLRLLGADADPELDPFFETARHADELASGIAELEGAESLRICAEAYWFLACLPSRALPDLDLRSPADDDAVLARVTAFRGRLANTELPENFRRSVARTWWTLYAFGGPVGALDEPLAEAISAGLAEEEVLTLALMGLHRRGAAEHAAAMAERLTASGSGDGAFQVLTVYHHETGDDEAALESLGQVLGTDERVRLARSILELRLGRAEAASESLARLAEESSESPLRADVQHALGVALAIRGELEGAVAALTLAAEALDDEAVDVTLAEVRARLEGDG